MAYGNRPTYLWRLYSVGLRSWFLPHREGHSLEIKPIARCNFDAVDRRSLPCVDMADTDYARRRLATEDGITFVEIISAKED